MNHLATSNEICSNKTARFSLSERQIDLPTMWFWIEDVFLLAGWLVVPGVNELTWFMRRARSTYLTFIKYILLMKRFFHDGVRSFHSTYFLARLFLAVCDRSKSFHVSQCCSRLNTFLRIFGGISWDCYHWSVSPF